VDIQRIKDVISDLHLEGEPAFKNLRTVISPHLYPPYAEKPALVLYDINLGCEFTPFLKPDFDHYLGALFPDEGEAGLIVLPPTASESTLLHELGHRIGFFYYNDLSEDFANAYMHELEKYL